MFLLGVWIAWYLNETSYESFLRAVQPKKKGKKKKRGSRSHNEFIFVVMHTYHEVWPIHQNDKANLYTISPSYR
jgi:hypothetical protein